MFLFTWFSLRVKGPKAKNLSLAIRKPIRKCQIRDSQESADGRCWNFVALCLGVLGKWLWGGYAMDIYIYILSNVYNDNIFAYMVPCPVLPAPPPPPWYGSKTYVLATFSWNPPKHMVFTMFWQARPPKPWYLQRFVILHCILLRL